MENTIDELELFDAEFDMDATLDACDTTSWPTQHVLPDGE
jgi:hypothetical protein